MTMVNVTYKCQQCDAVDHLRCESDETPLPALNCFKCHAGMEFKNYDSQCRAHRGMFPTGEILPDPPSALT